MCMLWNMTLSLSWYMPSVPITYLSFYFISIRLTHTYDSLRHNWYQPYSLRGLILHKKYVPLILTLQVLPYKYYKCVSSKYFDIFMILNIIYIMIMWNLLLNFLELLYFIINIWIFHFSIFLPMHWFFLNQIFMV